MPVPIPISKILSNKLIFKLLGRLFWPAVVIPLLFDIFFNSADVTNGIVGATFRKIVPAGLGGRKDDGAPPTIAETVNDAVNNPISLFGIAAVGVAGVLVLNKAKETSNDVANLYKGAKGGAQ